SRSTRWSGSIPCRARCWTARARRRRMPMRSWTGSASSGAPPRRSPTSPATPPRGRRSSMRWPGAERRRLLLGAAALAALAGCASPETERIAGLAARGIVLTVNFDLNSYAIRQDAREVLDPLAAAMNDPRLYNHTYEVNGHTDSTGRLGRNM